MTTCAHTRLPKAAEVIDIVERWQQTYRTDAWPPHGVRRRRVLPACRPQLSRRRPTTKASTCTRTVLAWLRRSHASFGARSTHATGAASGFFAWVEGAPGEGYRAPRTAEPGRVADRGHNQPVGPAARTAARPVGVLTGTLGAQVIEPLIESADTAAPTRVIPVRNDFFGGNVGVTGLMVGADLQRVLARRAEPGDRYLLPDVCLSNGRFLDGLGLDDLPHPGRSCRDRRHLATESDRRMTKR